MYTLTDPRTAPQSFVDGAIKPLIRDERDVSLARTMLGLAPAGAILVAANFIYFTWWTALAFWLFYLWNMGPCTLGMHNMAHRPMFKNRKNDFRLIALVGVFFGHAPGTYPGHHLAMHHREGNGPEDTSSTLKYQRDSLIDFFRYSGRFLILGLNDLGRYFVKKNRKDQLRTVLGGELGWYAFNIGMLFVHVEAALCCFLIPTITTRFLLMAGNWAQHAFIDPQDWDNPYRSVTTFVNSAYNARCFNDGYHLNHHLRAGAHWTEMPERFEAIMQKCQEQNAIVFRKTDYFILWALLMAKQHKRLADLMIDLGEETTTEQRIALLRERLTPIRVQETEEAASSQPIQATA